MGRISKIQRLGIGDKVEAYHIAGKSHAEIIQQIEKEHPGANLTQYNISVFLKKRRLENQVAQIISKGDGVSGTPSAQSKMVLSAEAARNLLAETVDHIQRQLKEQAEDPRALAVFLKLQLEAAAQILRATGGYQPEWQTRRCSDCPHRIDVVELYRSSIMDAIRDEPEEVAQRFLDSLERYALSQLSRGSGGNPNPHV